VTIKRVGIASSGFETKAGDLPTADVVNANTKLFTTTSPFGGDGAYLEVATAAPEPSTMFILRSGLIGLAGYERKKFSKK